MVMESFIFLSAVLVFMVEMNVSYSAGSRLSYSRAVRSVMDYVARMSSGAPLSMEAQPGYETHSYEVCNPKSGSSAQVFMECDMTKTSISVIVESDSADFASMIKTNLERRLKESAEFSGKVLTIKR
jgi:hypothetical protein